MWICGQRCLGSVAHDGEFIGTYPCDAGDSFTVYALESVVSALKQWNCKKQNYCGVFLYIKISVR